MDSSKDPNKETSDTSSIIDDKTKAKQDGLNFLRFLISTIDEKSKAEVRDAVEAAREKRKTKMGGDS
jgi:hypothetical protein